MGPLFLPHTRFVVVCVFSFFRSKSLSGWFKEDRQIGGTGVSLFGHSPSSFGSGVSAQGLRSGSERLRAFWGSLGQGLLRIPLGCGSKICNERKLSKWKHGLKPAVP